MAGWGQSPQSATSPHNSGPILQRDRQKMWQAITFWVNRKDSPFQRVVAENPCIFCLTTYVALARCAKPQTLNWELKNTVPQLRKLLLVGGRRSSCSVLFGRRTTDKSKAAQQNPAKTSCRCHHQKLRIRTHCRLINSEDILPACLHFPRCLCVCVCVCVFDSEGH